MRNFLLLSVFLLLSACNPYHIAWSTAATTRELAFQTEAGLSKLAKETSKECLVKFDAVVKPYRDCRAACPKAEAPERPACLEVCRVKYGAATKPYTDCLGKYPEALNTWIKVVRPAINSALTMTVAAIQLAEQNKEKNVPWLEYLKPALCAVCVAITQWDQLMPASVKTYSSKICKFVTAATCKEVK
jgi:hypothetical protein